MTVDCDHVDCCLRAHSEDLNIGGAVHLDHVGLAVVALDTVLVVILEEGVHARTIDKDVLRVQNTNTPSLLIELGSLSKIWITVLSVDWEWHRRIRVGLEVWRLSLEMSDVNVLCLGNLVVVKDRVLTGSSPHPNWAWVGLNEDTTAVVDVDLAVVLEIELVVGNPEPAVLNIDRASWSNVEEQECNFTVRVWWSKNLWSLLAGVGLQLSAGRTTNTEVHIPKTVSALLGCAQVPLHKDGTWLWTKSLKDELRDLNAANLAWVTDAKDWLWVCLILEEGVSTGHDEWPELSSDADVVWNLDGRGDNVSTVVEVDDVGSTIGSVEDGLNGGSIVGDTITLGTCSLDRLECLDWLELILWLGLGKHLSISVEHGSWLGGNISRTLNSTAIVWCAVLAT